MSCANGALAPNGCTSILRHCSNSARRKPFLVPSSSARRKPFLVPFSSARRKPTLVPSSSARFRPRVSAAQSEPFPRPITRSFTPSPLSAETRLSAAQSEPYPRPTTRFFTPTPFSAETRLSRRDHQATALSRKNNILSAPHHHDHPPRRPETSCAASDSQAGRMLSQPAPGPEKFRLPSAYQTLKLVLGIAVAFVVLQALFNFLVSISLDIVPPLLTYTTMALVCWPWIAALGLGTATLLLAAREGVRRKAAAGESADATSAKPRPLAYLLQQVVILSGALTWLILVPCGHFQGFLGAWPLSLFSVYLLFFAESAFIRCYLYGDLAARAEDKQWASPTSRIAQVLFVVSLVAGHWFAALESPLVSFAAAGVTPPRNVPAFILLLFALWLHWDSTLILGKYFDRLVPPQLVVTTGPYRWIRHPIYTSYMLLFAGFCAGLRSYKSLAFLLTTCLIYYFLRTRLEEDQLMEHFGDVYGNYKSKVTKKFLPYLF